MSSGAIPILVLATILLIPGVLAACSRGDGDADAAGDIQVELRVSPDPPAAGPAVIEVVLRDEGGEPVDGADLEIEGNMTHAGMQPVVVGARGLQDGRYVSDGFEFTMGGDWIITVRGALADGRAIERRFNIEGVSS